MNINSIKNIDWFLFALAIVLIFFGLLAIYTTSFGSTKFVNFEKQAVFSVVGIISMVIVMFAFDYRALKTYSGVLYLGAVIMLILTVVLSSKVRGVYSWFSIGGVSFQPAEFIKIILVIVLAKYFSTRDIKEFKHVIISGIYAGIFIVLIAMQPDLGMAAIFLIIWLAMLLGGGIKAKHFVFLMAAVAIVGTISWNFVLKQYQRDRIIVFLDPARDPRGIGYNIIQSKIAIGSGGLFGKGLGYGTQSQLNFLPEKYSDFIFAVIAEEAGFLGVGFLFLIFGLVFKRIFSSIKKINDDFGKLLVYGGGIMIFSNFFVNIAANLSLLPVTGVPLPLISYGGSSMITTLLVFGLIQSVIIRNKESYKIKQNIIDIE